MERKIIATEDGSHTLFVPSLDEHYHSVHGAIQESEHVFIEAGLRYCNKTDIAILEVGFGTGLNALLSCIEAIKSKRNILYHSLEYYPLSKEEAKLLNYGNLLGGNAQLLLDNMHRMPWDEQHTVEGTDNRFVLKKINANFVSYTPTGSYDLVFFDAFGPDKQEEMWQADAFEKIAKVVNKGGMLLTYSAKGTVKRALRAAGFKVTRIPGPPGKREMIRALML